MSKLAHIMIDLETRGTIPGCVGFSLGAVRFYPQTGELGEEFYSIISISDSLDCLLSEDADTVEWWNKQSPQARAALEEALRPDAPKLAEVLESFNDYLRRQASTSYIRKWGNGADFDNPILRVMYDCAKVKPFAGGYGGRCYRTIKNLDELLGPEVKFNKLERRGTHHNALDDAKSQAVHLMDNIRRITTMLGI